MARPRSLALTVLTILCLSALAPVRAEEPRLRMVVATNVACGAQASRAAAPVRSFRPGDVLSGERQLSQDGGDVWYLDQIRTTSRFPGCWVYGPLTTEFMRSNPEPALVAAIEHILRRADTVTFEEYVEVENLLLAEKYAALHRSSGLRSRKPARWSSTRQA